MNLKTSSTCLLIIFVAFQLASCANASPTPAIVTSTPTSQPALTATPQPSATPSPAAQPIETNTLTPEPFSYKKTIADFANFDWTEQWWGKVITEQAYFQFLNEPMTETVDLTDPILTPVVFNNAYNLPNTKSIYIDGVPGKNLFLQHVAQVKIETGIYHVIHWKVVVAGDNGQNILRDLSVVVDPTSPVYEPDTQAEYQHIAMMTDLDMKILTHAKTFTSVGSDWVNFLLTDDPRRVKFQKGIIGADTGSIFL